MRIPRASSRSILKIGILTTTFFTFNPAQNLNAAGTVPLVVQTAKDDDLVKEACKLFWNLSSPKSSASQDMASWAKRNKPSIEKALTRVAQAKKLTKSGPH